MKAIVRDNYGPPDVLELRDIDRPEIADDEVLVRVHAAGVDRGVWQWRGVHQPIQGWTVVRQMHDSNRKWSEEESYLRQDQSRGVRETEQSSRRPG